MEKRVFGRTKNDENALLFTFENKNGMKLEVSDFGATLVSLCVPDKYGRQQDVVLGYDSLKEYEETNDVYFGATIGRNANRIADARFTLNDEEIHLPANEETNSLHSGPDGYHLRQWKVKMIDEARNAIIFQLASPNGDQGFPGDLFIEAGYELTEDNEVIVTHTGLSTADTVFNPTNHSYFNLNGHNNGTILNHQMQMNAKYFTPVEDHRSIPTGEIKAVDWTPMDFTKGKGIGEEMSSSFMQLLYTRGYDHNFVLDREKSFASLVVGDQSGITMKVSTDLPGVQFYTGNFLKNKSGKEKAIYQQYAGFCLEAQYFPDAVNHDSFDSPIIRKGELAEHTTIYQFQN